MSLLTWEDGTTWWLRFDAVTVEEFARDAEITTYPIETGAVLSDHYQPQPRRLRMEGVVSDTPSGPAFTGLTVDRGSQQAANPPAMIQAQERVRVTDGTRLGRSGVTRPLATGILPSRRLVRANLERAGYLIPKFVTVLKATGPVDRVTQFILTIDRIMEKRFPVNLIMFDGIEFKNMMIETFRAPRVSGRGGSVTVSLDLQEVLKADPVDIDRSGAARSDPKTKQTKNGGSQGTSTPKGKDIPNLENIAQQGFTIR